MKFYQKNKYSAKRCTVDGISFDSKAEGEYYLQLLLEEKAGQTKIIELQPKIYLSKAKILYKPDFHVERCGVTEWIDVKGVQTPVFKLKKKLWRSYGPGKLILVEKRGKYFYKSETVESV